MGSYEITRGPVKKPVKAVLYGVEGVGKTTFASKWPNAVFIDVEDGSGHYDVARYPRPETWESLLDEIRGASSDPNVETLVVDTVDAAEALCIEHVLRVKKWSGIEDPGFGKGFTYLCEEFSKLFDELDECVSRGKNVLLLAHAQIKKFEQPDEMGSYDRWELKLQKKNAPLVKEWCDLLLFATFKTDLMKDEQTKKYKAAGGKKRVMYASHTAAYDAKNRLGLPDSMPFEFDSIKDSVHCAFGDDDGRDGSEQEAEQRTEKESGPVVEEQASESPSKQSADKPIVLEEVTEPEIKQLHQLMADYGVNDVQLRRAVGSRKNNPYSEFDTIADYDIGFIRNTLLKHWEAIVKTVHEQSEIYDDIPFD